MASATDKLITRNWRFTFWSAHANTFFVADASVTTRSGNPMMKDALDIESAMLDELQRQHGKGTVRGLICTGWSPLDDEVEA